jgi:hypothetical protein
MKIGSKVIYLGTSCRDCGISAALGKRPFPEEGKEYTLLEFKYGGKMISVCEIGHDSSFHTEDFVEACPPEDINIEQLVKERPVEA